MAAIENGSVACVIEGQQVQANTNEIRSYSWSTLVPQETAPYSSEQARNERQALWTQIQNNISTSVRVNLRMFANQRGLNDIGDQQLIQCQLDEFPIENQSSQLRDFIVHRDNLLNSHEQQYRGNAVFADFISIAKRKRRSPFSLSQEDIQSASLANYGSTTLFQQSFSKLFGAYRDMYLENLIQ